MIIQLIGLPCSGKSTILKATKKYFDVNIIDKKDFFNDSDITSQIISDSNVYIIESAQGLDIKSDHIVMLRISKDQWLKNVDSRPDFNISTFNIDQFKYDTIPANFTIYNSNDFLKILKVIIPSKFKKKELPHD